MIESIRLSAVATYPASGCLISDIRKINFIYGSNGSGKTTVSNVLRDCARYPQCSVRWHSDHKLEVLVYNRDFIDQNFSDTRALKGVFTLGSSLVAAETEIAEVKATLGALLEDMNRWNASLNGSGSQRGKIGQLEDAETKFKDACWRMKQKFDSEFQIAFRGFRGDSEKFKANVLSEEGNNDSTLIPLDELRLRASTVYAEGLQVQSRLVDPVFQWPANNLVVEVLLQPIIGKEDVGLSSLILKLNNSDWVRRGLSYLAEGESCPFCQQTLPPELRSTIEEFFDETYNEKLKIIEECRQAFRVAVAKFMAYLGDIDANSSPQLEADLFLAQKEMCRQVFASIDTEFGRKLLAPSMRIELTDSAVCIANIKDTINRANQRVDSHNLVVNDLNNQRSQLTRQVWRFVLNELKADLAIFKQEKADAEKGIKALNLQLQKAKVSELEQTRELSRLEGSLVNSTMTVETINTILAKFDFKGFKFEGVPGSHMYRVTRQGGSPVDQTLSEGEKTFITFLCF